MKQGIKETLKRKEWMQALQFVKKNFWHINYVKTLFLNMKWLPLRQALHFPIIVGTHVDLRDTHGSFEIEGGVHFGMFQLSFDYIPTDTQNNRVVLVNHGKIIIKGNVYIRSGVKIWVEEKGVLSFGGENAIGTNTLIVCQKKVEFGFFVVCAWNCQIYDTNFHFFRDMETGDVMKRSSFVKLADHVWIGNSVHLTKGTRLPKGCLVSNRSVVNRSFMKEGENIMIAGHPAVKVLDGIEKIKGENFMDGSAEAELMAQLEGRLA